MPRQGDTRGMYCKCKFGLALVKEELSAVSLGRFGESLIGRLGGYVTLMIP